MKRKILSSMLFLATMTSVSMASEDSGLFTSKIFGDSFSIQGEIGKNFIDGKSVSSTFLGAGADAFYDTSDNLSFGYGASVGTQKNNFTKGEQGNAKTFDLHLNSRLQLTEEIFAKAKIGKIKISTDNGDLSGVAIGGSVNYEFLKSDVTSSNYVGLKWDRILSANSSDKGIDGNSVDKLTLTIGYEF